MSQDGILRVNVEMDNEIYYPKVSFVDTKTDDDAEQIKVNILPKEYNTDNKTDELVETIKRTSEPTKKHRLVKRWRTGVGSMIVAAIAICAVALVGLRIIGFRTFTVMSGSMSPEYPVGALIYVKPVNYYDLKEGDVISYVANDDKTVVTHRIVGIEIDEKDSNVWRFKTQGDANTTPDGKLVHYKNVLGTPVISIPYIGYFVHNVQQPPGIYIALVVGTLLLAWTFLPGTLEERRKTARKSVA